MRLIKDKTQCSTYRVYDYDRLDAEGELRELHLEKAMEVTTVQHQGWRGGWDLLCHTLNQ